MRVLSLLQEMEKKVEAERIRASTLLEEQAELEQRVSCELLYFRLCFYHNVSFIFLGDAIAPLMPRPVDGCVLAEWQGWCYYTTPW